MQWACVSSLQITVCGHRHQAVTTSSLSRYCAINHQPMLLSPSPCHPCACLSLVIIIVVDNTVSPWHWPCASSSHCCCCCRRHCHCRHTGWHPRPCPPLMMLCHITCICLLLIITVILLWHWPPHHHCCCRVPPRCQCCHHCCHHHYCSHALPLPPSLLWLLSRTKQVWYSEHGR